MLLLIYQFQISQDLQQFDLILKIDGIPVQSLFDPITASGLRRDEDIRLDVAGNDGQPRDGVVFRTGLPVMDTCSV